MEKENSFDNWTRDQNAIFLQIIFLQFIHTLKFCKAEFKDDALIGLVEQKYYKTSIPACYEILRGCWVPGSGVKLQWIPQKLGDARKMEHGPKSYKQGAEPAEEWGHGVFEDQMYLKDIRLLRN